MNVVRRPSGSVSVTSHPPPVRKLKLSSEKASDTFSLFSLISTSRSLIRYVQPCPKSPSQGLEEAYERTTVTGRPGVENTASSSWKVNCPSFKPVRSTKE